MTDDELKVEATERAAAAAEVFGEEPLELPAGEDHQEVKVEPQPKEEVVAEPEVEPEPDPIVDPWAGVPPALRQTVESLQSTLGAVDFDKVSTRIKQLESRVGSMQNEFHAAKEAQKVVNDAPSKEEMAKAAKTDEAWDALKEDYSEWGEVLDEIGKRFPTQEEQSSPIDQDALRSQIREELKTDFDKQLSQVQAATEEKFIGFAHKTWRQDINTPEWAAFISAKPVDERTELMNSQDSSVIIEALNEFKKKQAPAPADTTAADIIKQNEKRLKKSVVPNLGPKKPAVKQKSWQDMTEAELRAEMAAEVFKD